MLPNSMGWIDDRFPLTAMYNDHMAKYPAPENLNFWVLLRLACHAGARSSQIITGIWLTTNFNLGGRCSCLPSRRIMQDCWLACRCMHLNRASAIHRGLPACSAGMILAFTRSPGTAVDRRRLISLVLMARGLRGLPAALGREVSRGPGYLAVRASIPVIGDDRPCGSGGICIRVRP